MPSGKTHAVMSAMGAVGLYAATVNLLGEQAGLALAGGCLAGTLITPDLDSDRPVRSHGWVRRNVGWLAFLAWYFFWLPYARLVPHRHWLSHTPVIGTGLRLLYLAGVVFLVGTLIGVDIPWQSLPGWLPWAAVGLGISDILHWAADGSWSGTRRLFRKALRWMGA